MNDRAAVTMLPMTGNATEGVRAANRPLARGPMDVAMLFEPSFAELRTMPGFSGLATKLGLLDYRRMSGHSPDFCLPPGAPPLFRGLKPTP